MAVSRTVMLSLRGLLVLLFIWFRMSLSTTSVAPSKALQFFNVVGKLKTLKRTGWVNHDIPLPESVADHMYRMSMLSFLITDSAVDKDELIKICLLHDLAEAKVGDITPFDGVSKEDKRRLEETALRMILSNIGHEEVAVELMALWLQYEEGTSVTSAVARELDKFEMIVQANEYEEAHPGTLLHSFFSSTEGYFKHPEILAWDAELRRARGERLAAAAAAGDSAPADL